MAGWRRAVELAMTGEEIETGSLDPHRTLNDGDKRLLCFPAIFRVMTSEHVSKSSTDANPAICRQCRAGLRHAWSGARSGGLFYYDCI